MSTIAKPGVRVAVPLAAADRRLLNACQDGFPVEPRPFRTLAARVGMTEDEVIARLQRLLKDGQLSRFGPVINPRRLGGESALVAVAAPPDQVDEVAAVINAFPQVSHNYERQHRLNLWFVVSAASAEQVEATLAEISRQTGLPVYPMPMLEEYWIGLKFALEGGEAS